MIGNAADRRIALPTARRATHAETRETYWAVFTIVLVLGPAIEAVVLLYALIDRPAWGHQNYLTPSAVR
jgi:hypothetical protein